MASQTPQATFELQTTAQLLSQPDTTRCQACSSQQPTGQKSDKNSPRPRQDHLSLPRVLPPPPSRHRAQRPALNNKHQKTADVRHPDITQPNLPSITPPTPTNILLPNILSSEAFPDPLADLDAFFTQMNAEITDMGVPAWSFDDMFVDDAFAGASGDEQIVEKQTAPLQKGSPTPSTESEQSLALDVHDDRDVFDFNFGTDAIGVMHSPADIPQPPPYQVPQADPTGVNDTTMLQTFGAEYGSFGDLSQFGGDANILGMGPEYITKLLCQIQPQPVVAAVNITPSLEAMLASTDWAAPFSVIPEPIAPMAVAPADLALPSPTLKRKDSASSEPEQPAKRPRGRPPKGRTGSSGSTSPALAKQPARQTKPTSTPPTHLLNTVSLDDVEEVAKRTISGKPSTARPKSVVPEKYFKDGTAQAITGMTMEQILAFPTYDELLKQVAPEKRAGAKEFGDRIAENRDKAKDAAKKSRDEKRQKIEQLEGQVEGLEDQVSRMKEFLAALLGSGRVSQVEVAEFV